MDFFNSLSSKCINSIFFEIYGFPAIMFWILFAGSFLFMLLRSDILSLMSHGADILLFNKKKRATEKVAKGSITHFKALITALSGTVGVGNISGTAFAIYTAGPGVLFWIGMAGIIGIILKFFEVALAQSYKVSFENRVVGGAFVYIKQAFYRINLAKLGGPISYVYSIFLIFAVISGGNLFQINQIASVAKSNMSWVDQNDYIIGIIAALVFLFFFLKDISYIGSLLSFILPISAFLFLLDAIFLIFVNPNSLLNVIKLIFTDAFTAKSTSIGIPTMIGIGLQRGFFTNMAGTGISTVIHAAANSKKPIDQACVSMFEPFIDTVFICFICGIAVAMEFESSSLLNNNPNSFRSGLLVAEAAFSFNKISAFVLYFCSTCFAFSVTISSAYVAQTAWLYIFNNRYLLICNLLMAISVYLGVVSDCIVVLKFADFFLFSLMLPNIFAVLVLSQDVLKLVRDREK